MCLAITCCSCYRMPQNAFFFYELAIFWSAKKMTQRHFFPTLHPLSPLYCFAILERILCLMSSDVMRHIRDKLYETLNTNLREKLVGCKTVYFGLVHLCREDPCQDLGGKINLEIWCPSGLKICILFSSKVKIYIKMRIKTFLGPV